MHDLRRLRDDPDGFDRDLARRGLPLAAAGLLAFDAEHRAALLRAEQATARRKALSRTIGVRRAQGLDTAALQAESKAAADAIAADRAAAEHARAARDARLLATPNRADPETPDGPDASANRVLRQWGVPPAFSFAARDHVDLGRPLGLDGDAGARLAGTRFTVLSGPAARLERALGQMMIDLAVLEGGCIEVSPPLLVQDAAVLGTGQLPTFADDLFRTRDGRWLIPTAEVPLTNLVAGRILSADEVPLRLAALTPCFRAEAGAAGRDTRGMLRQHQFHKVELVSIVLPEDSDAEHGRMTARAEAVLQALELPHRVVDLCAGDLGFAAARTFDLEVWLPGQQAWREISSCSNCRDFQARRMGARIRRADGTTAFVHTLNGSGVAVGRALVAVLEVHQQADGSIRIPERLRPYLGGLDRLSP
jgi:seryl-tRNA synthetase